MEADRRKYKRLPLKMTVLCQKVGGSGNRLYSGTTVNVCSGGMLVEMNTDELEDGELLSVEVSVPPSEGLPGFGGSFSSYARVLRIGRNQSINNHSFIHSIAMEFCQCPKYRV